MGRDGDLDFPVTTSTAIIASRIAQLDSGDSSGYMLWAVMRADSCHYQAADPEGLTAFSTQASFLEIPSKGNRFQKETGEKGLVRRIWRW